MKVIDFKNVDFSYGPAKILHRVSFDVEAGEVLVILGGSGSGKSTILRLIMGLIDADKGEVLFNGEDIVQASTDRLVEMRHKMGMVFQEGALFDSLTVGENVGYYLMEHGMGTPKQMPEVERRVLETLKLVGLEHTLDMSPNELSGGMRRRVAAARTLIYSPDLILYDEPTTGLDPATCENFCKVMLDIKAHKGVTSIMVTHNMEDAFTVGDKFLLLHEGRAAWFGRARDLKKMGESALLEFFRSGRVPAMTHG